MFNQFNEFSTINYTETNKHNFTINFNITICCNTCEQEYSTLSSVICSQKQFQLSRRYSIIRIIRASKTLLEIANYLFVSRIKKEENKKEKWVERECHEDSPETNCNLYRTSTSRRLDAPWDSRVGSR